MKVKKSSPTSGDIVKYIEAILVGGFSKRQAYRDNINADIKNIDQAISVLERKAEFKALYETVLRDHNTRITSSIEAVKASYVDLIGTNIKVAKEVLEEAEDNTEKARAVRLANETISSMAIINSNSQDDNGSGEKINVGNYIS